MAIVSNPLIGKSRKSVGGVTFSSWKGRNVLKTKPLTVANPSTPAQQRVRAKLSSLVGIYRFFAVAVALGFKNLATNISAYNAFVKVNSNTDLITFDSAGNEVADYSKMFVASGSGMTTKRLSPEVDSIEADGAMQVNFVTPVTQDMGQVLIRACVKMGDVVFVEFPDAAIGVNSTVYEFDFGADKFEAGEEALIWIWFEDKLTGQVSPSKAFSATVG